MRSFNLWIPVLVGAITLVRPSGGVSPAHQGTHPADVILRAVRLIEGDSAEIAEDAWEARARGQTPDPEALLGLLTLASLRYDFSAEADLFDRLDRAAGSAALILAAGWLQMGESLAGRGEYQRADSAYSTALRTADRLGDDRISTWARLGLARIRYRLMGFGEARRLQREAELRIPSDDFYLQSRMRCARAASTDEIEEGAAMAEGAGIRRMQAACMHILANFFINRGETGRAARILVDVERIQREIGDRGGRAATLQWLGYNLRINNDLEAARLFLTEAVKDGVASHSEAPVAWAHLNLGQIRLMVGDVAGALAYADSAEVLLRGQGDQWGIATVQETRGLAATQAGQFQMAREALEESLRAYQTLGNGPGVIGANTGLFNLALAVGDLEEAARYLSDSRDVVEQFGMAGWERSLLFEEADLARAQGDLARAKGVVLEILNAPEHPRRLYGAKVRLAEIQALEGSVEEAEGTFRDALSRLDRWRREAALPELRRFAFQTVGRAIDPDLGVATIVSLLAASGREAEAFELAEAQRARDLLARLVRESVVEPVSIDSILANPPVDATREDSLPTWTPAIHASDLQESLPDEETALVEYFVGLGGEPTTAFVITSQSLDALRVTPIDSLAPFIGRFRLLAESGADIGPLASELGEALIRPVVDVIGAEITRIVIVPDGDLHRLPFDALQVQAGRSLIQDYQVSLAPSAAVAAHLWTRPAQINPPRILAFGDPAFSNVDEGSPPGSSLENTFARAGGLYRLPASGREARRVARYAAGSEVRLGDSANEDALKAEDLTSFRIIHLATHAVVSEGAVGATALALAPDANEDGFLVPGDLASLRLAADVVTLSACQTAGGVVVRGEGVLGLTAPLLQAGARSVLATTWRVEDRATMGILEGFYGGLADGLSAGEALRDAKVAAIERGSPPSEWAAFVLVGDPTVRVPLRRPQAPPVPLIWAAVLLVVTLVAYLTFRLMTGRPVVHLGDV